MIHDFSLVLTKKENCIVVSCVDYPKCIETITIFALRDRPTIPRRCCQ